MNENIYMDSTIAGLMNARNRIQVLSD